MDWQYPNFGKFIDVLFEGVYVLDASRRILFWNKGAERLTGIAASEVVGHRCHEEGLHHVDGDGCVLCSERCPAAKAFDGPVEQEGEIYLRHRDGHRLPVRVRTLPLTDKTGRVTAVLETFTDSRSVASLERRLEELEAQALADPLTGIANRRHLEEHLNRAFDQLRRVERPFGVLYVDLDDFKRVNDRFGHEVGDRVLRMVAKTLAANLRAADLAARLGGEEFVAVIALADRVSLLAMAERFRQLLRCSWLDVDGERVAVTASIGVTLARPDDTPTSLLGRADDLMYRSKMAGKDRVTAV
jgi:diguanylate cyclase (GGDEF)-like protein/PAS domain S-box-containing protein